MKELNFLVCENYLPEFRFVVEEEGFEDVKLLSFPAFCDGGFSPDEIAGDPAFQRAAQSDSILVCSHTCRAPRKTVGGQEWFSTVEAPNCYSQLVGDQFSRFFAEEGYYVITAGWLNKWELHLKRQGFSREGAQAFYKGWCRKLVLLDSGIDNTAVEKLNALSDYLGIPGKTIPVSLDSVRALIKNKLYEWRLKHTFPDTDSSEQIREMREENAKNAAVLNIMSRIASAGYMREVISMLEEVWLLIFGATRTSFWANTDENPEVPAYIRNLNLRKGQSFTLDEETMTLYARLESGGENYGVFEVGGFLFPQNIVKYTDLFDSIIKIGALAISNAQRYEDLIASRNKYEHSSYHDGLTGLYNRSYYKKLCSSLSPFHPAGVFAIDVNGFKIVNDTLGHSVGDTLIKSAADTLKKTFRADDSIIRMGGDEFAVIIEGCDEQRARTLSQRLRDNISTGTASDTATDAPKLSLSHGYAVTSKPEDSLEEMMHQADEKMYEDKRKRKKTLS